MQALKDANLVASFGTKGKGKGKINSKDKGKYSSASSYSTRASSSTPSPLMVGTFTQGAAPWTPPPLPSTPSSPFDENAD